MNRIVLLLTAHQHQLRVRRPFLILLLIAIVLAIYAPSMFGEVCSVDDSNLLQTLQNSKGIDIREAFLPRAGAVYYRPIIMMSFYLDRDLLKLYSGFMKFENVIFHIINSLLVYLLTYQLLSPEKRSKSMVPLLSGLFFGLNPVNTESVNWISGRSDLLACVFVLLSANCLIKFKRTQNYVYLPLIALFVVLGALTKEASIAFTGGAFLLIDAQGLPEDNLGLQKPSIGQRRLFLGLLFVSVALFLVLAHRAYMSSSDRIAITLKIIFSNIPYSFFVVLNALAFYVKKIFFPFPLNFAIVEPEPLYDFLGLPLLLFCLYIVKKRTEIAALFMTGILLITPALLIAFKQIAWAAYAERYVYMASSFIIVASTLYAHDLIIKKSIPPLLTKYVIAIILVIATIGTLQRNIIWMHNITLYEDMVDKSPNNFLTRTGYGYYLADAGDYSNARMQFLVASKESSYGKTFARTPPAFLRRMFGYAEDADMGLAYVLEKEGKVLAAAKAYERILERKRGKSVPALNRLVPLYVYLLSQAKRRSEIAYLREKLFLFTGSKYGYDDAQVLYSIGKMFLARGEKADAMEFFRRAHNQFGVNDEYRIITKKILDRLGSTHDTLIHKTLAPSPVA